MTSTMAVTTVDSVARMVEKDYLDNDNLRE